MTSAPRQGRGLLRGRLRTSEDWDSSATNEVVAADFDAESDGLPLVGQQCHERPVSTSAPPTPGRS